MSVLHETGLETPLHKNFAKFKKKKNSNPQNLNHIVILQLKHIQKKKMHFHSVFTYNWVDNRLKMAIIFNFKTV